MKQEKNIETKAQSQTLQGNEDAVAVLNQTTNWVQPNFKKFQSNSILDSQGLGRDGPPGRARSPGTLANQFPDHPPDKDSPLPVPPQGESLANRFSDHPPDNGSLSLPVEALPEPVEGELSNNKQMNINILNKKQIFNFYKHFNFLIMKKQILILVFLLVAVFASVNLSYGQCDDALHPVAGKAYTYTITTSPSGGTYNWYVVTSDDLMAATATIADGTYLTGGSGYNTPTSTTANVVITWSAKAVKESLAATTKFYVVVDYAQAGATCNTDNLKAYKITPINLFQILVENVTPAGVALAGDICRSNVISALANATGTGVAFDYGENVFYLKVTAKYFTTNWVPTIDIAALKSNLTVTATNQSITSIEWARSIATLTGTSNFDLATGVGAVVPDLNADGITSGIDEIIYIKILIDHAKFEGTADQSVKFNLSAVDASGNPDVDKDALCADITPDPDNLIQILKARPAITDATPVIIPAVGFGPFIPAN